MAGTVGTLKSACGLWLEHPGGEGKSRREKVVLPWDVSSCLGDMGTSVS